MPGSESSFAKVSAVEMSSNMSSPRAPVEKVHPVRRSYDRELVARKSSASPNPFRDELAGDFDLLSHVIGAAQAIGVFRRFLQAGGLVIETNFPQVARRE